MATAEEILSRILGYENRFTKFLIDPLYGQVGLDDDESKLIENRLFARLKNIRQLGFVSEVYPSAMHKRFEHSIGTLHITWLLLKRFAKNYLLQEKWSKHEVLKSFSDETIEALRLSALLHDIGHGPFSHAMENIAQNLSVSYLHDQITSFLIAYNIPSAKLSKILPLSIKRMIEEEKSLGDLRKFQEQLSDLIPIRNREIVLSILEKNYEPSPTMPEGFEKIRYFLHDLIKGDVGADRIDYLLRDTYFAGLGHRFNLSDLLDNLRGIFDEKSEKLILAIDSKGRDSVEFLLTTRYYHYRLIAHHPSNVYQQVKLQKRLQAYIDKKLRGIKGPKRRRKMKALFFEIASKDENIERDFPVLTSNLQEMGSWTLGAIAVPFYRFLVYRVLEDHEMRQKYLEEIKENICNNIGHLLGENEFHIEVIKEKPHIPTLHQYQLQYEYRKKEEESKDSALLHDHSTLINGLADAYLSSTSLSFYLDRKYRDSFYEYTRKTHSFFLDEKIFTRLLSDIDVRQMSKIDLLLVALYRLTQAGTESFYGMHKLYIDVQEIQRKINSELYKFREYVYDPESRKEFLHNSEILNDVFLFDFSRLIEISRVQRNVRPVGVPRYSVTYIFRPITPSKAGVDVQNPLKKTLDFYPSSVKDLVNI